MPLGPERGTPEYAALEREVASTAGGLPPAAPPTIHVEVLLKVEARS
jgi:hypothetical protein